MFHLLLLVVHLCIVETISQTVVRGVVGQAVTLPCTYGAQHGTTHMCWGRGSCPNSKCSNEILTTDGMRVISRTSSRYQLRGWITRGDVSLTIVNLKEGDKGIYCCRIEVPGWFNDLKKNLNLQVDIAITTTSQATTTTKSHTVPITTTSVSLTTTVSPTTAFLLTTPPLVVPTSVPLTTTVTPMTTSSMKETTEFLTSDPPFININPSTTSLQTTHGYEYNFLPTESEIGTSTAVTPSPPGTLLTPKNTENIDNWPTSVPITPYFAPITNMSHTFATLSAKAPLTTTVTVPTTFHFLSSTTSSFPTVPAIALPITNVSSMTTCATSAAVALLTASPPLVHTESPSSSSQHEGTASSEADASSAGIAGIWKMLSHPPIAVSCAVVVLVLFLLLLVLIVKRKNIRQYHLNKTKCVNKVEEPEKMLIGTEGENGLFSL